MIGAAGSSESHTACEQPAILHTFTLNKNYSIDDRTFRLWVPGSFSQRSSPSANKDDSSLGSNYTQWPREVLGLNVLSMIGAEFEILRGGCLIIGI